MTPFLWFIWMNERMAHALRPPRRKPALRVIEGGRRSDDVPHRDERLSPISRDAHLAAVARNVRIR